MTSWAVPTDASSLAEGEVHIWKAHLIQPPEVYQQCRELLCDEELERAGRFYFDKDRNQYVVSHGMMRQVLGRYLGIAPTAVRYRTVKNGKPDLGDDSGPGPLQFNMSHSGELALLAITRNQIVGVDVELHRPDFAGEDIAERFFSTAESTRLFTLPAEQRVEAFFKCWTRKEAYIKAIGDGLSIPLSTFQVAFVPGEPAGLLHVEEHPEEVERWRIYNLEPGEGYSGAIMVEGQKHELKCWLWNGKA